MYRIIDINLCLFIFVGVITADKLHGDIQGHVPGYINVSTLIKNNPSVFNRPIWMSGQSSINTADKSNLNRHGFPFKNIISIKGQSSINTNDKSSINTTDLSSVSTTNQSSINTIDLSSVSTTFPSSINIIDLSSVSTTDQSSFNTVDQSSVSTTDQSSINTTDHSSVSTTDQSSINTIDQSSIYTTDQSRNTNMQSGSLVDCDGRCNHKTLTCSADGFTCICKEDYVDVSYENSNTKDCSRIETTGCPRGWKKLEYPDKCLRVFSITGMNVSDTPTMCARHYSSAQLATLDSRGLAIFAGKLASDKGSFKEFRFGLSFNTVRKRWVWPSGYTLDLETSVEALQLEVNNPNSEDMCASIVTTNNGSHWDATSCNNSFLDGYICEIDNSQTGDYTSAIAIIVVASIFATIVGGIPIFCCLYFIVIMIYECIRECFPPHKKSQSEFSGDFAGGRENTPPNTTFATTEYEEQSDRRCNFRINVSENADNDDDPISINAPSITHERPTVDPSFVFQSSCQEDRNATTAVANNLNLASDVQGAVAAEKVDLPSYKLACETSSPCDRKSIKIQDDKEDDSDEPPSYLEALHIRSMCLKL